MHNAQMHNNPARNLDAIQTFLREFHNFNAIIHYAGLQEIELQQSYGNGGNYM